MTLPSADKFPRMIAWLAISVALAVITYGTMPVTPEPSRWAAFLSFVKQMNNVTAAGWICYWLDRGIFYYARPHQCYDAAAAARAENAPEFEVFYIAYVMATWRRAFIIAAGMIAVGLGQ